MGPDWTALSPDLLMRIGQLVVQQAAWGAPKMVQAVRFASVCQAFRAASLAAGFWSSTPQLELHWTLSGAVASSLVRAWATSFQVVKLDGAEDKLRVPWLADPPPIWLGLPEGPCEHRRVCIDVHCTQQRATLRF